MAELVLILIFGWWLFFHEKKGCQCCRRCYRERQARSPHPPKYQQRKYPDSKSFH